MELKSIIKLYNGSSFPTLVTNEIGEEYVMKMKGAGNGIISLVSEFIANRIAHNLNWNVPNVYWIKIEENYPWLFGTDEFDDILTKSYGWNLAIQKISYLKSISPTFKEMRELDLLNQLITLDYFFINIDRSNLSYNFLLSKMNKVYIIDHGSLALFYNISMNDRRLFKNHIYYNELESILEFLDERILDIELFKAIFDEIPDKILLEINFNKEILTKIIEDRISFIKSLY